MIHYGCGSMDNILPITVSTKCCVKHKMLCDIIFKVVMLLFLLLNYGSYWMFLGHISKETTFIVPFILAGIIFTVYNLRNGKFSATYFLILLILCANIFLSNVFNNDFSTDNFLLIITILTAFFVTSSVDNTKIVRNYVQLIIFLSIYSLVSTYIILPLCLAGVVNFIPTYMNTGRPYYDMGFTMCLGYYGVPRNCGFCREPGVFQIYLTIAEFFLIEKMPKSKSNIIQIMLVAVTLLTTFSAVAYVSLIIICFLSLKKYSRNFSNTMKHGLIVFLLVIIIFGILLSNESIKDEFRRTFSKWFSMDSGSTQTRFIGIFSNFALFLERPLFGYGLANSWLEIIGRYGLPDVTGTPLIAFSGCGILFGIITSLLLIKFCKCGSLLDSVVCWLIIFLAFSSQNLILSMGFWIPLFLRLKDKQNILS